MTAPENVTMIGTVSMDDADVDSDLAATENNFFNLLFKLKHVFFTNLICSDIYST